MDASLLTPLKAYDVLEHKVFQAVHLGIKHESLKNIYAIIIMKLVLKPYPSMVTKDGSMNV